MRFLVRVVFFLMLVGVLCGCASATVSYSSTYNEIGIYNEIGRDLRWVTDQINNESIIRFDGDICYMNASMRLYSGSRNFYINSSTCSDLRIYNKLNNIGLYTGHYLIDGVKITSWNHTLGRASDITTSVEKNSQESITTYQGYIRNCVFEGVKSIGMIEVRDDIYNISIVNCSKGIVVYNASDVKFYNIHVLNLDGSGIEVYYPANNIEVYNVSIINAGNYLVPTTGKYGVYFQGVNHSSMHDIYVNGTGWSSLEATGSPASSYIDIYNATVINSGHDGVDLHFANDVNVRNLTINDSIEKNIIVTYSAGGIGTYNISFTDIYSAHHGVPPGQSSVGAGASIGVGSYNVSFFNFTSDGDGAGIIAQNMELIKLKNISVINEFSGISFTGVQALTPQYAGNSTLIDSDVYDTVSNINIFYSTNTRVINTKYDPLKINYGNGYNGEWTKLYYGDFKIIDSTGFPLEGYIDFSDLLYSYTGTDAIGNAKKQFVFDGRTSLPIDSDNSIAIPEFYRNSSLYSQSAWINYSTVATITTPMGSIVLDKIKPSQMWYRQSPGISRYTITALFNNSENPHLTGFAPSSEYNKFKEGDTVKFQIWANEPLECVSWEINGTEIQNSTSTTFETVLGSDPITVNALGANENGTVTKTWVVGGGLPIAGFTTNTTSGIVPLTVQFTDTSAESPTSWSWDFDGDGIADSTEQNPVYTYPKAGTYTVTLTATNIAGSDTETKLDYLTITAMPSTISQWFWYIISFKWW